MDKKMNNYTMEVNGVNFELVDLKKVKSFGSEQLFALKPIKELPVVPPHPKTDKLTFSLTEDQHKTVLEALGQYQSFAVYGEGREAHEAFVQRIINLLAKAKIS